MGIGLAEMFRSKTQKCYRVSVTPVVYMQLPFLSKRTAYTTTTIHHSKIWCEFKTKCEEQQVIFVQGKGTLNVRAATAAAFANEWRKPYAGRSQLFKRLVSSRSGITRTTSSRIKGNKIPFVSNAVRKDCLIRYQLITERRLRRLIRIECLFKHFVQQINSEYMFNIKLYLKW